MGLMGAVSPQPQVPFHQRHLSQAKALLKPDLRALKWHRAAHLIGLSFAASAPQMNSR